MAKFYGTGMKSGRVGGSVFSIRGGAVIERQYNPSPLNPSTKAQVSARAKLKMMSQLSAVLQPILAFRRNGMVSPRNMFTKVNYISAQYDDETAKASVNMSSLKLTDSVLGMTGLSVDRQQGSVTLSLTTAQAGIDGVVYGVLRLQPDGSFRLVNYQIVETPGVDGRYATDQISFAGNATGVAYAYAFRLNSESARAIYGSIRGESTDAVLEVMRTIANRDITYTESVGSDIAVAG